VPSPSRLRAGAAAAVLALLAAVAAAPAADLSGARAAPGGAVRLAADSDCHYPAKPLEGKPWSLQRVMLDQVWLKSTGGGVIVGVIDSGVDPGNPQLAPALAGMPGMDFFTPDTKGAVDENGHGTMAAGIIAARPDPGTGFVGLAYDAMIMPIRQNGGTDTEKGNVEGLAVAIRFAADNGASVINISQETSGPGGGKPGPLLESAIRYAVDVKDVVVVAAAGNSGDKDNLDTYPADYEGVLAVGASDRNNDRAAFSQNKPYVGVLAPGVDMWSTVPKGGHCRGDGTSFAAPYASAVAALIRSLHPSWTARQVVTVIEQTAQRGQPGHLDGIGWGVVDPLRAVAFSGEPGTQPVADAARPPQAAPIRVAPLTVGPTRADRDRQTGTVVAGIAVAAVLLLAGSAVVVRDARNRRQT
jgi:membrane-anchored mycosin MYCP